MNPTDVVVACADLAGRAGATGWNLAWTCPHVPDDEEGHTCDEVTWTVDIRYQGARLTTEPWHGAMIGAAMASMAMAQRILTGGTCRCGDEATVVEGRPGCLWKLVGQRWEPGCDAPPVTVKGGVRGDHAAMTRAIAERVGNRAERRAAKRGKR